MNPIGLTSSIVRLPVQADTARPAALRPDGPAPADRPERPELVKPERLDRPLRTDRPDRPDSPYRPDRPVDVLDLGRKRLAHITRNFIGEAKEIMKSGGTWKDVAALAEKYLENFPALKKFPPFQNILKRIAYNLNNGGGPTPVGPGIIEPAEAVATLTRRDHLQGPVAKNPVLPTKLSVIV